MPPDHPSHHLPDEDGYRCGCAGNDIDFVIWMLMSGRGFGKRLCVDTPIPTPRGWTRNGDLRVGDDVFDEAGNPCRVTAVWDGTPQTAYRVTFSDGTHLDADAEHQWVTWTYLDRKAFNRSSEDATVLPEHWPAWRWCGEPTARGPRVRTTQDITDTLTYGPRADRNHSIPVCGPLDTPEADLPIAPYTLGVWLGDGTSVFGTVAIGHADAPDMIRQLTQDGCPVGAAKPNPQDTCASYLMDPRPRRRDPATGRMTDNGSMHSRLRMAGLLDNKHVPAAYLRASAAQRLALLQGLMDTDGSAAASSVEFCNTNKRIVDGVVELARSLGQKPVVAESRAMLNGKDCGPRWRVTWRPTVDVFRLPRKLARVKPVGAQAFRNTHRMIVSVERIDPKPMRCITVDSPHHMYLAGEGMIPTHNSLVGSTWLVKQALTYPESEWGVFAPTFRDVRKTCIEGSTGILSAIDTGDLRNYRRNELQIQFANGSVIYGYSADQPERARGANLHGAWCVARGELVTTSTGLVAIEDVTPGMMAWTRAGYRRVTAARMTAAGVPVLRVATVGGFSARMTPEHRVWVDMYGWVQAMDLKLGHKLRLTTGHDYCDRVDPDGSADVFDLTVDGMSEFFASGILVHNCDELGSWRYEATWHEGLVPALRKGERPRIVVTTTPRPTKLIKDLTGRKDGSVHITRGSTWENARNLAKTALAELKRRYEGTRLGRQELEGELLDDIEGALWSRSMIDADRVKPSEVPDLTRVVVAIDPAVTSGDESDESGIVVAGHCGDQGYVLADYSLRGTPNEVINKAIWAYQYHDADVVIAEVNNGGDYIGSLLRTVNANIPYQTVRASRGKAVRAEPVSSLYEMHRVHHVGSFPEMEDQMCSYVPGVTNESPDRMDALVWAITALPGMVGGDWADAYGTVRCFTCGHMYVRSAHEKCPKCGTVN